jgi:hypothetical protein
MSEYYVFKDCSIVNVELPGPSALVRTNIKGFSWKKDIGGGGQLEVLGGCHSKATRPMLTRPNTRLMSLIAFAEWCAEL